jgi:hypothetical protein
MIQTPSNQSSAPFTPPNPTGTPIPMVNQPKPSFDPRIFFILLIIIGIGGGIFFGMKQIPPPEIPIPTITLTPTPGLITKPINPLATQSGFLDLSKSAASLSSAINAMQVSDTTLVPPSIELPLGFPNQ